MANVTDGIDGAIADQRTLLVRLKLKEPENGPGGLWKDTILVNHHDRQLNLLEEDYTFHDPHLIINISRCGLELGNSLNIRLHPDTGYEETFACVVGGDRPFNEERLVEEAEKRVKAGWRSLSGSVADRQSDLQNLIDQAEKRWQDTAATLNGINQSLTAMSYAPMTPLATGGSAGALVPTSGGVTAIVRRKISEVLGWQPRLGDARGLAAALNQSFARTEAHGIPVFTWTPRSYFAYAELSDGLTGAQASLFARAKTAVDAAREMLGGLYSLSACYDEGDMVRDPAEVAKQLAPTLMDELLRELGRPGGPRIPYVDNLFSHLLGNEDWSTPDEIEGRLGELRDAYSLSSNRGCINTSEDERNATNYRILVDSLLDLRRSWVADRNAGNFTLSSDSTFLGTQLVWLERGLWVVAEAVEEVRAALASVLIGVNEQRTLQLFFVIQNNKDNKNNEITMSLDDLLNWIQQFATDLGQKLVREGGRSAIQTEFQVSVKTLANLVEEARDAKKQNIRRSKHGLKDLPIEFAYPRVQSALRQLESHLTTLKPPAADAAVGA